MIRIIPLLFLLLLLSSSAEATNWCDDANNQVCYLLEEGSGTATDDASINDNDATLSTADLWSNASPPDTYSTWYTDFSNDSFTSDASVGVAHLLSSKTYVMWMMVNNETLGGIATQIGATKNNNETIITLNTNTLLFGHSGSTGIDVRPVNNSYSDDTWFHLGIYWDGGTEADNCHILIDGVEVSYGTRQDGVSLDSTSGYDTVFGYAESPNAYFDGQLDEIAMFDTELDSTDINMIMDTGLGHEFGVTDWCDDANAVG